MTTSERAADARSAARSARLEGHAQPRERTPWLLASLCLLVGLLPSYSVPPGPLKSNGSPATLIAVVLFGLVLLSFALVRRTAATRTLRPGVVIILVYFLLDLAVYGIGLSHTDGAMVEASKTRAIIRLAAMVGIALYAITRVETARQRSIVLGCLATGLTFACFVAVLQNATNVDLHLLFQPPGFVVNTADQGRGADLETLTERFGSRRAIGTAAHPIELSVMAAVTVPLTIHFGRFATRRPVRWLSWLACAVALVALPASVSRSGVLALAAALLIYIWTFKVRQLANAALVAGVGVLLEITLFPNNTQALWNTIVNARDDASVIERTQNIATVSKTFHDHPLFGIGLGGTPPAQYGYLDNEWLQALVQGGALGALAMIVLAVGGIFGMSAARRAAGNARERDLAYAIGAMWFGMFASSFTFDLFSYLQATSIFAVLYGLLWSNYAVTLPGQAARARPD